jgi:hypothetical protein
MLTIGAEADVPLLDLRRLEITTPAEPAID